MSKSFGAVMDNDIAHKESMPTGGDCEGSAAFQGAHTFVPGEDIASLLGRRYLAVCKALRVPPEQPSMLWLRAGVIPDFNDPGTFRCLYHMVDSLLKPHAGLFLNHAPSNFLPAPQSKAVVKAGYGFRVEFTGATATETLISVLEYLAEQSPKRPTQKRGGW